MTQFNIGPYGKNVSKCFFSETTWTIETKLPIMDYYVFITITGGGLLVLEVSSAQQSVLLSLGRCICWWTISPRGYHPPSSQFFYHWVDTSAGGLLVLEGIIRPVISASALTWFIKYIYYRNLQFLYNVIINKTNILLLQAYVTVADFNYPKLVLWIYSAQNFQSADVQLIG